MNRREFIAASAAAGALGLAQPGEAAAQQQATPEFLEIRRYHMPYGTRQRLLHSYLSDAAIPAMGRLGIGPVGAFTVSYGTNLPTLYVLIPHRSLDSVVTLRQRLEADAEYRRAGAAFLEAPLAEPGFVRVESALFRGFEQMPRVEVPASTAARRPRIFELRTYESHSDRAALRKIEMFNRGEIAIFRRTGLTPVFFGEGIVGPSLPNLTYMLTFDDMAARDAAWARFSADPEWRRMAADPYYADTVSAITDVVLRPTAYSQI